MQRLQLFPDDTILSPNLSELSDSDLLVRSSDREGRHVQQKKRTKPVFGKTCHFNLLNCDLMKTYKWMTNLYPVQCVILFIFP